MSEIQQKSQQVTSDLNVVVEINLSEARKIKENVGLMEPSSLHGNQQTASACGTLEVPEQALVRLRNNENSEVSAEVEVLNLMPSVNVSYLIHSLSHLTILYFILY